ncbi:hypothetical protein I7I48_01875 [Histoplasma ohiense]|nr:hypothetical protein I7I48_01875 [Histoplasma ohiense (nom. inval.)]
MPSSLEKCTALRMRPLFRAERFSSSRDFRHPGEQPHCRPTICVMHLDARLHVMVAYLGSPPVLTDSAAMLNLYFLPFTRIHMAIFACKRTFSFFLSFFVQPSRGPRGGYAGGSQGQEASWTHIHD